MIRKTNMLLSPIILTVFALVPVWKRFENAAPPLTPTYVLGAWIGVPLILAIVVWFASGMPGFRDVLQDRRRAGFLLVLLLLVLWAYLSWNWAFMRETRPGVAEGAALQLALVMLFVVVVASAPPPTRWLIGVLVVSMLISAAIGGLQVARHRPVGLFALGEIPFNPLEGGTSVIQSGARRWLRPYGLTVHPNLLAGFLAVGVLACGALIVARRRWVRWAGTLAFWFGLWMLFLSFSRGAWIGFAAGAVALLPLLLRVRIRWRPAGIALAGALVLALAFAWMYRPLLITRTVGVEGERLEQRSINERTIYNNIATIAVERHPVLGVGTGNFTWFASYYLFYETDLNMRGDNVHQVFLYAHAELGAVGLVLVFAALVLGVEAALRSRDPDRAVLLAGVVCCAVIGLVDHYFWTIVNYQALWWGLLAAASQNEYQAVPARISRGQPVPQPGSPG